MKTNYQELKKEKEDRFTALMNECRMFFAFSNEQFTANKTQKEPDEKYLSIGAGSYMPKSCYPKWESGSKEINKWYKSTLKSKKLSETDILFELNNHEAFYTGDLSYTFDALEGRYTHEQIREVYNKYRGQFED